MRIDSSLHEVGDGHSRNLDRILERKEDTGPCTFLWTHSQKVLAKKLYAASCHSELRLSSKHCRQGTLSRTVRAHHSMYLSLSDDEIHTFQYFLILN